MMLKDYIFVPSGKCTQGSKASRQCWRPIFWILVWGQCWQACLPGPQRSLSRSNQLVQPLEFEYLKLSATISCHNTKHSFGNAYVKFRVQKDQCIWFTVLLPGGIEIMRGMITTNGIALLNHIQKTYAVYDYKTLQSLWPGPWGYSLIQALLLGEPILERKNKIVQKNDRRVVIQQQKGAWFLSQQVNVGLGKMEELVATNDRENIRASYSYFKPTQRGLLFGQASFSWCCHKIANEPAITVTLAGVKAQWPQKALKFPFNIPAHYEKMD